MNAVNRYPFDIVESKLQQYSAQQLNLAFLTPTAVLILLIPDPGEYTIVMTSRSTKVNHHTGEMSFPGGRFDQATDLTLKDTALRETLEEIGIGSENINVIGVLDDLPTFTGYLIRPFIGIYTNSQSIHFKLNSSEVSAIIQIPISFLLQENLFHESSFLSYRRRTVSVIGFDFLDPKTQKKYHIWGASAHILGCFLRVVYGKIVTSPEYHRLNVEEFTEYFLSKNKKE